jgi:diguanylate cyclase (GGDEF)-like protein/PAS domain S-box-containing protein
MEETITQRTNELHEQKVFFETLFSHIPVAVVVVDQENRIVACNKHFETLFGYRQVDVLDRVLDPLVTTEETLAEAESYTHHTRMGEHTYAICKRKRKDGSLVDVEMQGVPILIDGKHDGALALYRDITDRLQAEEALKANEARFRSLFENSPIALWEEDFSAVKEWLDDLREKGITDFRNYFNKNPDSLISAAEKIKILDVNQATISMFKAGCKEEMLTNVSKVLDEASWDVFRNELIALANDNFYFEAEIFQKRCDGETLIGDLRLSIAPGYEDTWKKVYVSVQDITQRINLEHQLKQSLKKMEYLASIDPLTGLLNRRAIIDFARAEFTRTQRESKTLGFALVDMDNLKDINDQYGHIVGDTALILLGETLENNIRIYDKVGRWGGDEFLVVIPTDRVIKVHQIAKRLKSSINDTQLQLPSGEKLTLQACIGVTNTQNGTKDIGTIDELLHLADEALYLAKKMGRNNIVFLDSQEE